LLAWIVKFSQFSPLQILVSARPGLGYGFSIAEACWNNRAGAIAGGRLPPGNGAFGMDWPAVMKYQALPERNHDF
jgi:hypothetical protein